MSCVTLCHPPTKPLVVLRLPRVTLSAGVTSLQVPPSLPVSQSIPTPQVPPSFPPSLPEHPHPAGPSLYPGAHTWPRCRGELLQCLWCVELLWGTKEVMGTGLELGQGCSFTCLSKTGATPGKGELSVQLISMRS